MTQSAQTAQSARPVARLRPSARCLAWLLAQSLLLSACATTSGGGDAAAYRVGPAASTSTSGSTPILLPAVAARVDVIVPVFDPGLSDKEEKYEEEGVWPELRRAEANRFAVKMKQALEKTNAFGAVRVTPDQTASGELYVLGTIVESNGAEVAIDVNVIDVSGRVWLKNRRFSHEVGPGYHKSIRNKGKDPYDPLFTMVSTEIVKLLARKNKKELTNLQALTEMRFGQFLVSDAFNEHLVIDKGQHKLVSLPSDDDPMLKRVRASRVREQLFVDDMQGNYAGFSKQMETSYLKWQEASLLEREAHRESRSQFMKKALLAAGLLGLAVAAGVTSAQADQGSVADVGGSTAAVASGLAAAWMASQAFQSREEAKLHQDALNELGESQDLEMGPRVISLEKESARLSGDASEQFAQWRTFLKRIHEQEKTPGVSL